MLSDIEKGFSLILLHNICMFKIPADAHPLIAEICHKVHQLLRSHAVFPPWCNGIIAHIFHGKGHMVLLRFP